MLAVPAVGQPTSSPLPLLGVIERTSCRGTGAKDHVWESNVIGRTDRDTAIRDEMPVDAGTPPARDHEQINSFRPMAELRHYHDNGFVSHGRGYLSEHHGTRTTARPWSSMHSGIILPDNDATFLDRNKSCVVGDILIDIAHGADFHIVAYPQVGA